MKRFSKLLLFIVILCSSPLILKSQTQYKVFENDSIIRYIEYLLKTNIDSLRQSKKLNTLKNDSILYLASIDHSKYLSTKDELCHFQKENTNKYSPQNRADYYGAKNYLVGENVLKISLNTVIKNPNEIKIDELKQLANFMTVIWIKSKNHYKNMINKSYKITGVSIYFNPENNSLYATQVFADIIGNTQHNEFNCVFCQEEINKKDIENIIKRNKPIMLKEHKKHAFKIKKDSEKKPKCFEKQLNVFHPKHIKLGVNYDSLFLMVHRGYYSQILKFFKHKKDGMLLEFLFFDYTYTCSENDSITIPTRKNGGCIFDGRITKPVYKNYIINSLKKNRRTIKKGNNYITVFLGKYPEELMGRRVDINFLVLQKNRLCKVMLSQGTCGDLRLKPGLDKYELLFDLPFDSLFRPRVKMDRVKFKVTFEKNDTNIVNENILENLKKILENEKFYIPKIILNAFSSVEGSYEHNQKLYEKRANNILNKFQNLQDSTIQLVVHTNENWNLFFSQLRHSKYSHWLQLDTNQIKDSVNVPETAKELEPILAKQRYGELIVYYRPVITEYNIIDYTFNELDSIYKKDNITPSNIQRAKEITLFLLHNCLRGKVDISLIQEYAENKKIEDVRFLTVFFMLKYPNLGDLIPSLTLPVIKNYYKKNKKDPNGTYNYLAYKFNSINAPFGRITPTIGEAKIFLNLLKQKQFDEQLIERFELYYSYHYLLSMEKKGWEFNQVKPSLDFIYNYYVKHPPNDIIKHQLALLFLNFYQYGNSLEYIKPLITKENFHKDSYILYLKINALLQMNGINVNIEKLLLDAYDEISDHDWCDLFIGPCNINIHIFDNLKLKKIYCERCYPLLNH